jgi:hypothetical protein
MSWNLSVTFKVILSLKLVNYLVPVCKFEEENKQITDSEINLKCGVFNF